MCVVLYYMGVRLDHVEGIEVTSWSSKCEKVKVGGSLAWGQHKKIRSEIQGRNLEEWKSARN